MYHNPPIAISIAEGNKVSDEKVNEFADFINTMKFLLDIKTGIA